MEKKTVVSLKHRPPAWISTGAAICLALLAAKGILIDSLPVKDELRVSLAGWFTYLLNTAGVLFSIASVIIGQRVKQSYYE